MFSGHYIQSAFYRLSIRTRLFGIVFAFMVPVITLTFFMVEEFNSNIRFAQWELKGNQFQRPVMLIMEKVMDHRLLIMRQAAGQKVERELAEVQEKLDDHMSSFSKIYETLAVDLQFTQQGLAARNREQASLANLKKYLDEIKSSKQPAFEAYAAVIDLLRMMITHSGDMSNLILDPDLDSYYLMDITLLALPQHMQRLSDAIKYLHPKMVKSVPLTAEETIEVALYQRLLKESDFDRIVADLATVFNEDANFFGVSKTLKPVLDERLSAYKSKFEALTLALQTIVKGQRVEPEKLVTLFKEMKGLTKDFSVSALNELDHLLQIRIGNFENQKIYALCWCGFALVVALSLFWFLTGSVTRPLLQLQEAMVDLSRGQMDIDIPCQNYQDEIGQMSACVESFRQAAVEKERLEEKNRKQEERARLERQKMQEGFAKEFEQNVKIIVDTVASASTELSVTAEGMVHRITSTSDLALTSGNVARETSANVQSVASAAEQLTISVREISSQFQKTRLLVDQSSERAKNADNLAKALTSATERINQVMVMISDIAGQINLLALNASIESARAGEMGKGFAVVASEVKNLANQTDKSISEIQLVLEQMREASDAIVDALLGIQSSVGEITMASSAVASAVEEQSATTNEISRSIQIAAKGTQEISNNLVNVGSSSSEAGHAAEQVLLASKELSYQAENLHTQVDTFLSHIRVA